MPTALVKDVLWRVSVLLADTAPQFQRFTEGELVRFLIDGQTAIAKLLPSSGTRVDVIKLVAGTRQSIAAMPQANIIPGDGITLTAPVVGIQLQAVIRNMGADGATVGNAVTKAVRETLDNALPSWHTTVAGAVDDYMADERAPTTFYVSPGVTGNVWVEAQYSAMPIAIPNTGTPGSELYLIGGGSAQTITIHDKHVEDLLDYVVARASGKDSKFADPIKATFHGGRFISSLNAQVVALTGVNPNLEYLPGGTAA